MRLDLIDEFHVNLFPCVAGEGTHSPAHRAQRTGWPGLSAVGGTS